MAGYAMAQTPILTMAEFRSAPWAEKVAYTRGVMDMLLVSQATPGAPRLLKCPEQPQNIKELITRAEASMKQAGDRPDTKAAPAAVAIMAHAVACPK
jgi:hypothetical protein